MNRFGQSNTDDLQKAIDEITNNAGATGAGAGSAAAELESQIKGEMGVPPVPPMSGADVPEMAIPNMAAPEAPVTPSATPAAEPEVEPVAEPKVETAVPSAAPAMGGDLAKVRESALQELIPLMDKVEITANQKFDIYSEVIESTKDKSIVEKAFEAAKAISDEKVKAESLLKLVQMIDTL